MKELIKSICYGREDLLDVCEKIAYEFGSIDLAEELCEELAKTTKDFLERKANGEPFTYTNY